MKPDLRVNENDITCDSTNTFVLIERGEVKEGGKRERERERDKEGKLRGRVERERDIKPKHYKLY